MFGYLFNILFTIYILNKFVLNYLWSRVLWDRHVCTDVLVTIPSMLFAIATLPYYLFMLSVGFAYRQIAHIILMLTMRDKYLGLITGCDAVLSLGEEREPSAITLILTVDSGKDGVEMYSAMKDLLRAAMDSPKYAKLFGIRETCMGFMYLKRRSFHVDEIIGSIEDRDLREFMNKHCYRDMPGLNTGNFDVYVGNERGEDGGYPIVIRVHHCLADGLSFYDLLTGIFCSRNPDRDAYANSLSEGVRKSFRAREIRKSVRRLRKAEITTLYSVMSPDDIFRDKTPAVESDTILTYLFEQGEEYVPAVKRIRRRFPNMNFNAIVLTAFSASLAHFYIKNCTLDKIPETISTVVPTQLNHRRYKNAYEAEEGNDFTNDYTLLYPHLCIVPSEKRGVPIEDYIVDRLLMVQKEFQRVIYSGESILNYTVLNIFMQVLPLPWIRKIYSFGSITATISTIPGGPPLELIGGDKIRDVLFFTPKQSIMGVCLTMTTYANKLQLGLKANRSKFTSSEDLDAILRGVFKYIDILDERTANY